MGTSPETPSLEPRKKTPEELAALYETIRRRQEKSMTYAVSRDPDKVVRWARIEKNNRDISLHLHMGFQIVEQDPKVPEAKRPIDTVVPLDSEGHYVCGDVILMVIDRYVYDYYLQQNSQRSITAMAAGKKNFRQNMAQIRVPVRTLDEDTGEVISSR